MINDGRFDADDGSHAILVGREVKTCNLMTWARWMEAARRSPGPRGGCGLHVAQDIVGKVRVSTVFLGLDHNFRFGRPLWFETMVFFSEDWGGLEQERYETYAEAEAGHAAMVKKHSHNLDFSQPKEVDDDEQVPGAAGPSGEAGSGDRGSA